MIFKKIKLILLFLVTSVSYAQDGIPIYSEYLSDNLYLLHPSMAGAGAYNQIRLTGRQQWFGQENAPSLITLSANARIGEWSGVGGVFFSDRNGFHSQKGGYVTYAHHILFSRREANLNQLSFGLSFGMIQNQLDETQFDPSIFDPIIAGIVQSDTYYNVNVGLSYNLANFSGHFTVRNLMGQDRDIYSEVFESNLQREFLLGASYAIGNFGAYWTYEPSFLLQMREETGEKAFDVNFKAYREMDFGVLWGGLSYRRGLDSATYMKDLARTKQRLQYITPIIGANYNNFMLSYTYSHALGGIQFDNGYHQLALGYDFLGGRPKAYDCKCPAIN
ncbi:MAG: hypothetical protein CMC08_01750 [Flavobacteriaceae bacterium]|nr:hypothetical protein [Flavobacteriaceae bacterium]